MRICDPEILLDAAACFLCIGEEMLDAEQIYLLCQKASGGGGAGTYEATDAGVRVTTDSGENIVLNV